MFFLPPTGLQFISAEILRNFILKPGLLKIIPIFISWVHRSFYIVYLSQSILEIVCDYVKVLL
jgi:hypothetical protein